MVHRGQLRLTVTSPATAPTRPSVLAASRIQLSRIRFSQRVRGPGRADLPGQGDGLVELWPGDGAGRELLGEDPGDARGAQRVGLGVERRSKERRGGKERRS